MAERPSWEEIQRDRDERVSIPLGADEAVRGLLGVDPESDPADSEAGAPSVECPSQSEEPR